MDRYGLIGKPLSHSFSANYFHEKFKSASINAQYDLFEIDAIEEVDSLILSNDLCGLNVTIPYKQSIIPLIDELSSEARAIGAVNCVKITDGIKWGYNTDAFGFEMALRSKKPNLAGLSALVLGNGGSSKAVQFVLKEDGVHHQVVSRSGPLNYNNLHQSHIAETDLIINTTPLGMHPKTNECPDIPYDAIGSKHVCIDLIYNPEETQFLKRCALAGATTSNGHAMLKFQAERSWEIWNSML